MDMTDPPNRIQTDLSDKIRGFERANPQLVFNNDVYQNLTSTVQNSESTNGDQRELFY